MTTPIDLSKYAKGRKLLCTTTDNSQLTAGRVYVSRGLKENEVLVLNDSDTEWALWLSRFVPVEDEASEFKAGDRVRITKRPSATWNARMAIGREFTISAIRPTSKSEGGVGAYDESTYDYIPLDCLELADAPPVAASPKVDKPREWDQSKYNGLDVPTYQQLSTLDKRIAVARAALGRPLSARKQALEKRFGPTPESDWSVFSTSGWES